MSFMTELESFLLDLQSQYGFLIPVDRMRQSLVCAKNVTDLEEVYYRLQSLVCCSQEQIEAFHSLFGQRFLQFRPPPPGGQGKPASTNGKSPEEVQRALDRTADTLMAEVGKRADKAEEAAQEYKRQAEQHSMAQEALEQARAEARGAKDARDAAAQDAALSLEQPAVKKAFDKMASALKKYRNECAKHGECKQYLDAERLEAQIRNNIPTENFQKGLEEHEAALMKKASSSRSAGHLSAFKALLAVITALKAFQKEIAKASNTDAGKKLKEANKANKTQNKKLAEAETTAANTRAELEVLDRRLKKTLKEKQEYEARVEKARREAEAFRAQNQAKEIVKEAAITHREIFVNGVNAVKTTNEVAELLKTNIKQMSSQEKQEILTFIRSNARVFKQTLRRSGMTPKRRRVDIKATVRAANRTNGEPMVIKYKQPKKSHAKVVCMVDISGSCRNASTLALYFMAMMDDAFPGGCKKFAFVNTLEPVDHLFRNKSADDGVQSVFNTIPTRGVYSDYGTTIHSLRDSYAGLFHKDTTLIILGDARNNKRDDHADDLKYLADRCHRVFWLNTDDPFKWNQGDSVIGVYEKAGAEVHHVATVGALLNFLSSVSIKKPT